MSTPEFARPLNLSLNLTQALPTERVTAKLTGVSAQQAHVFIGDTPADVVSASGETIVFSVPPGTKAGSQVVRVDVGGQSLKQSLEVLGKVSTTEVAVWVKEGVTKSDFSARLSQLNLGLSLIDFRPLSGPGPCTSTLARVGVPSGQNIGAVLSRLRQPAEEDVVLQADPQSLWGLDVDHLTAIGIQGARQRGRSGKGVTIAILDTGVTQQRHLGQNLLAGYDFVEEDSDPSDAFDDSVTPDQDGHGTPVAVLAAGAEFGVAPNARILPIRIGDAHGQILASQAVRGVCFALKTVPPKQLVLNLSFGGDTPTQGLKNVLAYALQQQVLIAVAAGNQGSAGPTHYPAAFDLPGLVAVGALQVLLTEEWRPASFSTHGAYVDIAAPGQGIMSSSPTSTIHAYEGTSFATPLVAGALALWREAFPAATPSEIEQKIKNSAVPLLTAKAEEIGSGMLNLSQAP
ncbi:S8 family serine peptidase [Deinococcus detaillensis]|uniref:S8 family serine peptidase n=1 Tax=Deinococcus detaillensis TaxID=2592048 RepID=A0A553UIA3_9DEIO|nr:S8 family serine peptidase [Deinococcus detaillensis]TSA79771.1 S8 family serine peptidase [Deinococcus detaillensis]